MRINSVLCGAIILLAYILTGCGGVVSKPQTASISSASNSNTTNSPGGGAGAGSSGGGGSSEGDDRHVNGGGHKGSQPTVQFTSTPPAAAAEDVEYTYTLAATDPNGGTVSFTLRDAPANATISGSVIHWTPTPAQARVLNKFTVHAVSTTTTSANQSWTVTPTGTVTGTYIIRHLSEAGEQDEPRDLSLYPVIAAVPDGNGGYTVIPGVGRQDGTFSIANVPGGYYWLGVGNEYSWTSAGQRTFGYDIYGRYGRPLGYSPTGTGLQIQTTLPTPSDEADSFRIEVPNVNLGKFIGSELVDPNSFTYLMNWYSGWPLLDGTKGDRVYVTQLKSYPTAGSETNALIRAFDTTSVSMTAGQTSTLTGALADVPLTNSVHVAIRTSEFAALKPAVNPDAEFEMRFLKSV